MTTADVSVLVPAKDEAENLPLFMQLAAEAFAALDDETWRNRTVSTSGLPENVVTFSENNPVPPPAGTADVSRTKNDCAQLKLAPDLALATDAVVLLVVVTVVWARAVR